MRFVFVLILLFGYFYAKGTYAGTTIKNSAVIKYSINNISYNFSSSEDIFVVDKIVDIKNAWQDTKAIDVSENEKNRVLTFLVSNLGNSEDNISLIHYHEENSSFSPSSLNIFIDQNSNNIFDNKDIKANNLILKADENRSIFLVSDMPQIIDGNYSYEKLIAKSNANKTKSSDDAKKIDIVIRDKNSSAIGIYKKRDYYLKSIKTQKIISKDNTAHTGSIIEYTIITSIEGNQGEIQNVILNDTIPKGTKYIKNSIILDGKEQTDIKDSDKSYILDNKIISNLGNFIKTNSSKTKHTLIFKVKIQ